MQRRKGAFDFSGTKAALIVSLALTLPAGAQPAAPVPVQVVNQSSRQDVGKLVLHAPDGLDQIAGHTSHSSHRSHSSHSSHSSHYSGSGTRSSSPYISPSGSPYTSPYSYPSSSPSVDSGGGYYPKAPASSWKYRPGTYSLNSAGTKIEQSGAGSFQIDPMPGVVDKVFEQLEFESYNRDYLYAINADGTKKRYYLPDRLATALNIDHWAPSTRVGIASYSTGTQENSVAGLLPQIVEKSNGFTLGGKTFTGPAGWKLSRLDGDRYAYLSPLKPGYISISQIDYTDGDHPGMNIGGVPAQGIEVPLNGNNDKVLHFKTQKGAAALYILKGPVVGSKATAIFLSCPLTEFDFYLPAFEFWLQSQL
ncbi:MAG: hypothetical protein U0931_41380 [Vulcanimicrobiota bacterium]